MSKVFCFCFVFSAGDNILISTGINLWLQICYEEKEGWESEENVCLLVVFSVGCLEQGQINRATWSVLIGDKTQLLGRSSRDAYSFSALFFEDQYYFVLLTSSVKSVLEDSRNPLQSQPHWCHYTCHQFVCVCACVRKSQKEICSVTVPGGSALSVLQYLFKKKMP